jgi:hypothetical protein
VAAAAATVLSLSPVVGVRAASRLLRRTAVAVLVDRVVVPRDMFVLVLFFSLFFDRPVLASLALGGASARLLVKKKKRPTQLRQQTPQAPAFCFFAFSKRNFSSSRESTGPANHVAFLKSAA